MTTPYQSQYWAHQLTLAGSAGNIETLSRSIANARVDLNPHQIDAALFALRSPFSTGAILADEVGLGKTIEAGIVMAQRWAERRRRILLIVPATLRKQWQVELEEKFYLPSMVLDSKSAKAVLDQGATNPFEQPNQILICSYNFASARNEQINSVPWDLVVVDEAHRLRNVYKSSSKMARKIVDSLHAVPKLLLTATPLQNSLMELYGLVSAVDPHVFGDAKSFRAQFVNVNPQVAERRNRHLRSRIEALCNRTLRKQVTEYVPFTRRISMTEDFLPNDDEQALYDLVSEYLQREQLIALPTAQRKLITLVLRKLLASSTFAIAGTLERLVNRLEDLAAAQGLNLDSSSGDPEIADLAEDFSSFDETADEYVDEDDSSVEPTIDPHLLRNELDELRSFVELATDIEHNAKGDALLPALKEAFAQAGELGAASKAVVFTESRRTQQYLFELLTTNGYEDQVAMINGTNDDPHSRTIYQGWLEEHAGSSTVTGSRPVDMKAAIIDHFRQRATILIATEAAAEGVNLQFCSLVVNYDLPWNPQRIEQRIGRCHRYGQKHDVLVLNFLNRRNAADQRVFQLLSEKFHLFDGLFGASDEVLGALESGVDIEKRIAELYQQCRSNEEIQAAFDALQAELDSQIQARMTSTRQTLLEHFDEEVTNRLKMRHDETLTSLDVREQRLLDLTKAECQREGSTIRALFAPDRPAFEVQAPDAFCGRYHLHWQEAETADAHFYRQDHALAQHLIAQAVARELPPVLLAFDYAAYGKRISVLEAMLGTQGRLQGRLALYKLRVDGIDTDEFLVFAAQSDDGQILDDDQCQKLMALPADVSPLAPELAGGISDGLDVLCQQGVAQRLDELEERNVAFFEEESTKLDRWADDLKVGLEQELKEVDKELKESRRGAKSAVSLQEKLDAQKALKELEGVRNRKRRRLYDAQDEIEERRDGLITDIAQKLEQSHTVEQLFIVRWVLN